MLLYHLFCSEDFRKFCTVQSQSHKSKTKITKLRIIIFPLFCKFTWYSINFSAWPLSSSLDSLKNLFNNTIFLHLNLNFRHKRKARTKKRKEISECEDSLGQTLECNIVSIEVSIHGMVHIWHIVFNTVIKSPKLDFIQTYS